MTTLMDKSGLVRRCAVAGILVALACGGASAVHVHAATSATVTVPATTPPSGTAVTALSIISGHSYTISATGTADCDVNNGNPPGSTCASTPDGANGQNGAGPGFGACGNDPEGNTCEVGGTPFGRLVGRIATAPDNNNGTSAANGTAHDYIDIGSSKTFTATQSGTLYLVFNDYSGPRAAGSNNPHGYTDYYQDNSGSYSVTIADNTAGSPSGPPTATPEADSAATFGAGLVVFASVLLYRRRRSARGQA